MFTRSARYYDALYAFKDYGKAAAGVRALIENEHPAARSLLDVACGTGRHLEHLRTAFDCAGLDINPDLLAIARQRCPDVPFHLGDMTAFDLGMRFDVVTCLFSSIAYAGTAGRMRQAVGSMVRHLEPGGLLLVEPWFTPERYWVGRLTVNHVDEPDVKITWMYVSRREDAISILDIHYLVGSTDGVDCFSEVHRMGLYTHDEYLAAFRDHGLEVEHDPQGFFDRGLYTGRLVDGSGG